MVRRVSALGAVLLVAADLFVAGCAVLLLAGRAVLLLAGCAGLLLVAGCAGGGPRLGAPGGRADFAAGSALSAEMTARDRDGLAAVFGPALDDGAPGEARVWSSGSFAGAVTPGAYLVGNLKPDEAILVPVLSPIAFGEAYETERGLHALTRTANLRAGPSTEAKILGTLNVGTAVDVVGKVVGKPWMLVAIDGAVRGYVHDNLMIRAPGEELVLAGGPTRRAVLCRAFDQRLTLFGRTDRWSGAACKENGEWRLTPASENAPQRLY